MLPAARHALLWCMIFDLCLICINSVSCNLVLQILAHSFDSLIWIGKHSLPFSMTRFQRWCCFSEPASLRNKIIVYLVHWFAKGSVSNGNECIKNILHVWILDSSLHCTLLLTDIATKKDYVQRLKKEQLTAHITSNSSAWWVFLLIIL